MNNKGSARDVVFIVAVIFMFAIIFLITHFAINTTVNQMINTTAINKSSDAVTALQSSQNVTNRLDYVLFALFIGLTLGLIITGWFIGGHPIFMVLYFIVIIIAVVVSTVLSNVWGDVSTASIFGSTSTSFPITNHLLNYLPIYAAVIGIIGLIVMFGKPYFSGEGGNL